jgi:hypothetical protein
MGHHLVQTLDVSPLWLRRNHWDFLQGFDSILKLAGTGGCNLMPSYEPWSHARSIHDFSKEHTRPGKQTKSYWTWPIEIVTFPIIHDDFPVRYVNVDQRVLSERRWCLLRFRLVGFQPRGISSVVTMSRKSSSSLDDAMGVVKKNFGKLQVISWFLNPMNLLNHGNLHSDLKK